MSEDFYEKELRSEQHARQVITESLLHHMIIEVHEHRDQMTETEQWHLGHKEKLVDHIEDLYGHIKKLEEEIIEAEGVVETTDCPRLDISEMKPQRVVWFR